MNTRFSSSALEEFIEVPVWDAALRLFHWIFAAAVIFSWASGSLEWVDYHYYSGLLVIGLLDFRVLWGFFGTPAARFSHFVKGPKAAAAYLSKAVKTRLPSHSYGHNPAGGLMVIAMLFVIGFQAFTGLGNTDDIYFDGPLRDNLPKWMTSLMGQTHEIVANVVLALIILHILAIIAYAVLNVFLMNMIDF